MARTYTAIDPVRHDGVDYAPGAGIELTDQAAGPLLAAGAIAEPNQHSGSTGNSPEASGAAALQADSAPQPSTAADGTPNTTSGGESPESGGAAGAPAAPQARAPVVPIGTKGKPAK